MELIKFLISYFVKEFGGESFAPIIAFMEDNNFDIKRLISNFNPTLLEPIIKGLMNLNNKTSPSQSEREVNGLNPIIGVADVEIVACLNNYFSSNC